MQIEITEKGFDAPVICMEEARVELSTHNGSGLFRRYDGKGFSFWNNSYIFLSDTTLRARADLPVLELHITRSGIWKGEWDGVEVVDFHPATFNLTYTPHVMTTAFFKKKAHYCSCDIHFDLSYLASLAADFPALDQFLSEVTKQHAATLSTRNHHCTHEMIRATEAIIDNPFAEKVQPYILASKVRLILTEALEKIAADLGKPLPTLRRQHKEALHHVKSLIESFPDTPLTHLELSQLTGLNECSLKRGFRSLFGVSPYQYHLELKMKRAKEMLLASREPQEYIAFLLGYSQSSSFGHEFKKVTGMTPAQFRKAGHR